MGIQVADPGRPELVGRIGINLFPIQLQGEELLNDIDDSLRQLAAVLENATN